MKTLTTTTSIKAAIESMGFKITRNGKMFEAFAPMYGGIWFDGRSYNNLLNEISNYFYAKFPIEVEEKTLDANDLKVGSIVRMGFCTLKSKLQSDWTIISEHISDGEVFINYAANCKVCNVTAKFFSVIIPHLNNPSCLTSKRCFTDEMSSYGNMYGVKAEIISI